MSQNIGKIVQVIGPVVDVIFETEGGVLPNILDALILKKEDGQEIVLECQQHIGENTVRTVSMESTDGLYRGMNVTTTGAQIKMPIGEQVRGRLLNVIGDTIDGLSHLPKENGYQIHNAPPKYENLTRSEEHTS